MRMEADTGGAMTARDVAPLFTELVAPALPSGERISLIAFGTYQLGQDLPPGQHPEYAQGLIATGDNSAYLAWVDGPPATVLPYDTIRDASILTVRIGDGDVPGLRIEADIDWVLIFDPPCSSNQTVTTLAMLLTRAAVPQWED